MKKYTEMTQQERDGLKKGFADLLNDLQNDFQITVDKLSGR